MLVTCEEKRERSRVNRGQTGQPDIFGASNGLVTAGKDTSTMLPCVYFGVFFGERWDEHIEVFLLHFLQRHAQSVTTAEINFLLLPATCSGGLLTAEINIRKPCIILVSVHSLATFSSGIDRPNCLFF
ncbi:unnamed protein product [Cochlearia groenlandica]